MSKDGGLFQPPLHLNNTSRAGILDNGIVPARGNPFKGETEVQMSNARILRIGGMVMFASAIWLASAAPSYAEERFCGLSDPYCKTQSGAPAPQPIPYPLTQTRRKQVVVNPAAHPVPPSGGSMGDSGGGK